MLYVQYLGQCNFGLHRIGTFPPQNPGKCRFRQRWLLTSHQCGSSATMNSIAGIIGEWIDFWTCFLHNCCSTGTSNDSMPSRCEGCVLSHDHPRQDRPWQSEILQFRSACCADFFSLIDWGEWLRGTETKVNSSPFSSNPTAIPSTRF